MQLYPPARLLALAALPLATWHVVPPPASAQEPLSLVGTIPRAIQVGSLGAPGGAPSDLAAVDTGGTLTIYDRTLRPRLQASLPSLGGVVTFGYAVAVPADLGGLGPAGGYAVTYGALDTRGSEPRRPRATVFVRADGSIADTLPETTAVALTFAGRRYLHLPRTDTSEGLRLFDLTDGRLALDREDVVSVHTGRGGDAAHVLVTSRHLLFADEGLRLTDSLELSTFLPAGDFEVVPLITDVLADGVLDVAIRRVRRMPTAAETDVALVAVSGRTHLSRTVDGIDAGARFVDRHPLPYVSLEIGYRERVTYDAADLRVRYENAELQPAYFRAFLDGGSIERFGSDSVDYVELERGIVTRAIPRSLRAGGRSYPFEGALHDGTGASIAGARYLYWLATAPVGTSAGVLFVGEDLVPLYSAPYAERGFFSLGRGDAPSLFITSNPRPFPQPYDFQVYTFPRASAVATPAPVLEFAIWPNPATTAITLSAGPSAVPPFETIIYDVAGREVGRRSGVLSRETIGLELPAGLYVVEVRDSDGASGRRPLVVAGAGQ